MTPERAVFVFVLAVFPIGTETVAVSPTVIEVGMLLLASKISKYWLSWLWHGAHGFAEMEDTGDIKRVIEAMTATVMMK